MSYLKLSHKDVELRDLCKATLEKNRYHFNDAFEEMKLKSPVKFLPAKICPK